MCFPTLAENQSTFLAVDVITTKSVRTQWEELHLKIQVQINDSGHLENSVLQNFTWMKLIGSNHHRYYYLSRISTPKVQLNYNWVSMKTFWRPKDFAKGPPETENFFDCLWWSFN